MQVALIVRGPLSVSFEVHDDFMHYTGGIYKYTGLEDYIPFYVSNYIIIWIFIFLNYLLFVNKIENIVKIWQFIFNYKSQLQWEFSNTSSLNFKWKSLENKRL